MKLPDGGVMGYYDKYSYYNDRCIKSDDCALPEKETDFTTARDFNYYGRCQSKKCQFKVRFIF